MAPLLRSKAATLLALLPLAAALLAAGLVAARVWRQSTPPREPPPRLDLQAIWLPAEPVEFRSTDGLRLNGWWVAGEPGHPPVVLCHGLGRSRSALVTLALALREEGFGLLLFDFRGHGESEGSRSTLGLAEKRDVLGAIDWLARPEAERPAQRVGIYGTGMGAHAAVLAAADRPGVRALVLDGLYPDVGWVVARHGWSDWRFGAERLGFLPRAVYTMLHGRRPANPRAADVLTGLEGRDVLLLAPAGDTRLADSMLAMYHSIPEQVDADGNLALLPATQSQGLFGEDAPRHHERVVRFFASRLASAAAMRAAGAAAD